MTKIMLAEKAKGLADVKSLEPVLGPRSKSIAPKEPLRQFYFIERAENSIIISEKEDELKGLALTLNRQIRRTRRITGTFLFDSLWSLLDEGYDISFCNGLRDEFLEHVIDGIIARLGKLISDVEIVDEFSDEESLLEDLYKPLIQLEKAFISVYTEIVDRVDAGEFQVGKHDKQVSKEKS